MKSIFLFTHSYPFTHSTETFLTSEIEIASQKNIKLTIIPLKCSNNWRELPQNINLLPNLANISTPNKIIVLINMIFSLLFWKLPFQGKYSPKSLRNYFHAFKYLYGSFLIKYFILKNKNFFTTDSILYSYWFNHTSLGIVLAKLKDSFFSDIKIVSRGHGFDVYEEEVGMYFPYRTLCLKYIDQVFTVSEKGKRFLIEKYPEFTSKFSVSRLGTLPNEYSINDISSNSISFISISSVIPIKRVELIFNSILSYSVDNPYKMIEWTHIGDGSSFDSLREIVRRNNHLNLSVKLLGFEENRNVQKMLSNNTYDIFLNLSITEGIPVSIMEAITVGIPILATDAGGNNEIVNQETGKLIPVNFNQSEFNEGVDFIINSKSNLRISAMKFYSNNFSAEKNFIEFYDKLYLL